MEIRIRETGQVMSLDEFRRISKENGTPFWYDINESNITDLGADLIFEGARPEIPYPYGISIRQGIEQKSDGNWYTKYVAGPIFTDVMRDGVLVTAAEQEVTYKANKDAEQAANSRAIRSSLLMACDWTQGKDVPDSISSAWTTYRQALRDVTSQEGFPWNIEWPTKPE